MVIGYLIFIFIFIFKGPNIPAYADLGKSARDLFTKGFGECHKLSSFAANTVL